MLLPINQEKEKDITPKTYLVFGESMSGKTYFTRRFPDCLLLNTDGNAAKVTTPSIEITDFETFVKVIEEIEEGKHNYKTIVIDLVDDILTLMKNYVCKKNNVESIEEIPFGRGFSTCKTIWQNLVVRLNQMPYNIIYISHVTEILENGATIQKPSLEQKYLNMTMGRCDMVIKCRKVGQTYLQLCDSKRDKYTEEDIKNKNILNILKDVKGVIDTTKNINENKGENK